MCMYVSTNFCFFFVTSTNVSNLNFMHHIYTHAHTHTQEERLQMEMLNKSKHMKKIKRKTKYFGQQYQFTTMTMVNDCCCCVYLPSCYVRLVVFILFSSPTVPRPPCKTFLRRDNHNHSSKHTKNTPFTPQPIRIIYSRVLYTIHTHTHICINV